MIRFILLSISFLIICNAYTQEFFRSNVILENKITYDGLSENESGKEIFQLLAIDNNIALNKLYLLVKARLSVVIYRNEKNRLLAGISLSKVSITGNTTIKDFQVDSLLWPSGFNSTLEILNGNHIRDEIGIVCTADGYVNIIDLSNYNSNIGDFSVRLKDVSYYFDNTIYQRVEKKSDLIKYYYSYGLLLDEVVSDFNIKSVKADLGSAEIFLQKVELDRINSYLSSHGYFQYLNLIKNDPVKLLKNIKKLNRYRKRAETLVNDQIHQSKIDTVSPVIFCNKYAALSDQYLKASAKLQPSDALGYKEVADISNDVTGRETLSTIIAHYKKNQSGDINIGECLVNEFVELCDIRIDDINYTDALLLLNNSKTIVGWFDLKASSGYKNSVIRGVSGITESYLKVGYMALTMGNVEFASQYLSKANTTIMVNKSLLSSIEINDSISNVLIDLHISISDNYCDREMFTEATITLEVAQIICTGNSLQSSCYKLDSAMCSVEQKFLNYELDGFEYLIDNYQYPDAYSRFESILRLLIKSTCDDKGAIPRYKQLAYSLYMIFLQQGHILMDAEQPATALDNLLLSRQILLYLDGDIKQVDSLIALTAEPVIVGIIEEGKYLTWANKLDEADTKYLEAIDLNHKYFNSSNAIVNVELKELKAKMKFRYCLDHINSYKDAIKTSEILIRQGKYDGLLFQLKKAQYAIDSFPECDIDKSELLRLRTENYKVIGFFEKYSEVRTDLIKGDFSAVIVKYIFLENYYKENKLSLYNIEFHSIEEFIVAQNLSNLTMAAIKYFIVREQPTNQLVFLKILIDQERDGKDVKNMTIVVAKNLAIRDNKLEIPVNNALHRYTDGQSKLNYFKIIYVKNRVVK